MPLLKKKTLEKATSPEFLRDDEEVFYCEITNEIFRGYEEFAERMLLCNSMVWTCSMTGKSNLTYSEALESEEAAKKSIKEFPKEIHKPILYIANKTKRSAFADMADDVFNFCKDRYFVGEKLEACVTANKWKEARILKVMPTKGETKSSPNKESDKKSPPPSAFKYEVEQIDSKDQDISEIIIVEWNQLRRRKMLFNREKCKLFLKQYVEQDSRGVFAIKRSSLEEFGITTMKFSQIFNGAEPTFDVSKRLEKTVNGAGGKKSKQESMSKYLTKDGKTNGSPKVNNGQNSTKEKTKNKNNLIEQMEKRKEEFQRLKQQKEEEKLVLKQKQKEKNLQIQTQLKEWYKPKEDLELEDQQELPMTTPVVSKLPHPYLGDALMIMEFTKNFEKFLKCKDFFQNGITLEIVERALIEQEVAGPLFDLIQMLLTAIFREDEAEQAEYRTEVEKIVDVAKYASENLSLYHATKLASAAAKWSKRHQGQNLRQLPMHSLTVTEILRLHILGSGARIYADGEKQRFQQRGGYNSEDDPALHFKIHKAHILKALSYQNVVQLPICDKIEVLNCLMNQLLTYADFRDHIEDRLEKNKKVRFDLKTAQTAERKRENDFLSAKSKLKKDSKSDPEATAKALEQLEKSEEKKKVQNERQIETLMKQSYEKETLLGSDRALRKYLKLESLPAVLINFEEANPGTCLEEPISQVPELVNADRDTTLEHLRKVYDEMNSSNKENSQTEPKKSPKKANGDSVSKQTSSASDYDKLLMCSAKDTCIVHGESKDKTVWSFIQNNEELDQFIEKLNKRGIRESELQSVLELDRENLYKIIAKTPGLNPGFTPKEEEEPKHSTRVKRGGKKNYGDANFGFPEGTPVEGILHNTLIDDILEMEEKIFAGSLGHLLVKNREEWRDALLNKNYSDFDRTIVNRFDEELNKLKKDERHALLAQHEAITGRVSKRYSDPAEFLAPNIKKEEIKTESEAPQELTEAVECLAIALAQVAQAVEPKYLKKPLGDSSDRNLSSNHLQIRNRLESWEQSLLASTSFSQVFLHSSTLDSCIMWSRSTLLAKCRLCRRQKDSENMLLCDSCNMGHHLYCLKPKLTSVPKGDWYCDRCTEAKEKEDAKNRLSEVIPKKKRRIFKDEDVEEEEEEEVEEEEEQEEMEVDAEDNAEECSDEEEPEENSDEVEVDLCNRCQSGGTLISCNKCSSFYHKECADPPPKRVTKNNWTCYQCASDTDSEKNFREKRTSKREKEESEDWYYAQVRHGTGVSMGVITHERRCATKARHNIYNFARSLSRQSASDDSGTEELQHNTRKRSYRRESGRRDLPLHNAALQDLLADVMKHKDSWPFLTPVQKKEVPDYYDVITDPMDFGTIKYKLNMGEYSEDAQLMFDAALIFQNCNIYNECESEIYKCGERLLDFFQSKCADLGLKIPGKKEENTLKSKKRRTK